MTTRITLTNIGDLFDDFAIDQECRKVALDMKKALEDATPVDTGALKGAWDIDLTGNPTIFNNLPYANRVMNGGHSKQAPAGTLDRIIDAFGD